MSGFEIAAGLLALGLTVYLFWVLLAPEDFS
ncbi:MAG: K(+)-transporting ATPase subunit F [Inhella sp.]